jgi:hypothetical protein
VEGVTTEDASDETRTTAVLHGSFTGNGEHHTYKFEWGPTTAYGNTVTGDAGEGTGKVSVFSEVEGLEPYLPGSQPYHYRLVATNSTGSTVGPDHTFLAAPPGAPQVSALAAEEVTSTEAKLAAMVNPEEGPTTYVFQYGPTSEYGSSTLTSESIGDDTSDHSVSETISGLTPGTTYHFRLVATNFGGTTHTEDETFVTPGVAKIESASASAVTQTAAHLSASVAANGSPTDVSFEYGTSEAYGLSTQPEPIGADLFARESAADLSGLTPGTTYHFRAVAGNGVGTAYGVDHTFTTKPVPQEATPPPPVKCKKGFVKRHGKCVKRRKHRKHRKQRRRHRHTSRSHG